jgi:hypothetical protein
MGQFGIISLSLQDVKIFGQRIYQPLMPFIPAVSRLLRRTVGRASLHPITWLGLIVILLGRLIIAIRWPNLLWPDEIFQTLEQGHRLVFGYGLIAWEYREAARSYLFPAFLSIFIALGNLLRGGSYGYLLTVNLALIVASLGPIWALLKSQGSHWSWPEQLLVVVLLGSWYELVYMAPKALSEVFASHLILTALPFALIAKQPGRLSLLLAGLAWGLAAGLRMQYLPAIGLIQGLALYRRRAGGWPWLLYGTLAGLLIVGLVDWLTWDYPFQSVWNNFYVNLIEGKSLKYGVAPWHYYGQRLWGGWALAGPVILGLALIGLFEAPWLGLLILAVLLPHTMVGHKEYRFVYLALFSILILSSFGGLVLYRFLARYANRYVVLAVLAGLWLSLTILIGPNFPEWQRYRGMLEAYRALSRDEAMCGLAILNVPWYFTGGYTYLHRRVPIFEIETNLPSPARPGRFNRFIIDKPPPDLTTIGAFRLSDCWGSTCLYRAELPCLEQPISFNRY